MAAKTFVKMHLSILAICGAVGLAHADTLGEEERFVFNQLNSNDFEVIRLQQMATAELWCAAGSYVERRLGRPGTTAIYVKKPLGPSPNSARKSVVFSLSNAGLPAAVERLTLTVEVAGATRKASAGRRYCRDAFTRSTK